MRKLLLGLTATLALAAAGPAQTATVTVQITTGGFTPKALTVTRGDTVTWHNADRAQHQVVADSGAFASPILKTDGTYSFTFKQSGRFPYHDALKSSLKGVITVKGPPPSLTFAANFPIVVYGTDVTLSGTVSSKRAGETVTILAEPYPQASLSQVTTVQTGAGGTYSYVVKPEVFTTYQAQWKGASSGTVILQVSPKITLSAPHNGYFKTVVSAGSHTFAGHYVFLQRLSALGQWISIAKYRLGLLSGKLFRYRPSVKGLSHIRIYMSTNQAGPGYLTSHSGSQPIRRR